MTDATGQVQFLTIYLGWYQGRTVHLYFKVRTDPASERGAELTSQLYLDDALTDQVHARPPYARQGQRTLRNAGGGIYRNGGDQLLLRPTPEGEGYTATFHSG